MWQELLQNKYIKDKTLSLSASETYWFSFLERNYRWKRWFNRGSSVLRMEKIITFGKTREWVTRHCHLNILHFIISLVTNTLEWLMCYQMHF
jgi:hypothetical protein